MSTVEYSNAERYKRYLIGVLVAILAFNYVDRTALALVLQGIKADLSLTDTQIGFLSGIAFAFFYALMGLPIARWADRGNRVRIITVTTALWSAAVALSGAAASFAQLLLIRVAVAIGEAGCIPPAHSLIADYFSRPERPRAMARYMLGTPIGLTIGFFGAGWLNEEFGWRWTFVALGLPGLVLAALCRSTLVEPRRAHGPDVMTLSAADPAVPAPDLGTVFTTLWKKRAFRHLLICYAVWYFFCFGILQWQPAFFVRSHRLETGEIGTWFALIYGVGGGLGTWLGGELAARYAAGNERLQLAACAVAFVFYSALYVCAFSAHSYYASFAELAIANLGGSMALGPILATLQTLVPANMRAMSVALVYLAANLIGLGLGPLATGMLSDALRPHFGDDSLRYALISMCPGYLWASWHLWQASRHVAEDLGAAQTTEPALLSAGDAQ